ncbi:MAG: hypothetical protein V4739_17720 [Pseudomonadota bacterium]
MKEKTSTSNRGVLKIGEPVKTTPETSKSDSASGRWSAIQRLRLPHKPGLPLSSGGGGDGGG